MRSFTIRAFAGALVIFSAGLLAQGSAVPTKACGNFQFEGDPHNFGGVFAKLFFDFTPSQQKCGADACTCTKIAYLQVIRARDMDNSRYIQPFEEQEERMLVGLAPELNGWAVDRLAENEWGYFAAMNTNPITFGDKLEVGTNAQPKKDATMRDRPERWKRRVRFEAVSVPVCMDTAGVCGNKMLGFRTWKFRVQDNKKGTDPTHAASTHWESHAVTLAIEKWNATAGPGVEHFPDELQALTEE
jgi:hypothetical protein